MKYSELNKETIIEVNGIELCFRVSMISNRKYEREQEECLLEAYYDFLNQSKKNGFMSQYIKMSVTKALCIFKESIDDLDAQCIRLVHDSE
ncbi:MAG: hypothetical protein NC235_12635 [Clostridiales bacterium]|nr:hypothetical protein [Clostridiales bacterium]